ncbi:hypothetical protein AAFC00_006706 [Neodothiora populina]|uniref:Prefoldin subunit n=1 Tax=Neodothiora populina TaxID=2781224 RepID=A0ABR3PAW7_9PEZI
MPLACPTSPFPRVGQASVNRNVSCRTELWLQQQLSQLSHQGRASASASRPIHRHYSPSLLRLWPRRCSSTTTLTALPAPFRARSSEPRAYATHQPSKTWRARAPSAKIRRGDALQQALIYASDRGRAPLFHFNASDISFTDKRPALRQQVPREPDPLVYLSGSSPLKALLAKHIITRTRSAVRDPSVDFSSLFIETQTPGDDLCLTKNGYDSVDLQTWISVLTAFDSARATRLLLGVSTVQQSDHVPATRVPAFVLLAFLRRHHISAEAFRLLVEHMHVCYHAMTSVGTTAQEQALVNTPRMSKDVETHVFRFYIRLLRHARLVWPEVMPAMTEALVGFMRLSPTAEQLDSEGDAPAEALSRLTGLLNRALYLISHPAAVEPYKSAVFQESAQAVILRHMAEHDPPLSITREGYRGVLSVQLVHCKTLDEMEWARLKAPSWPPWKEDRTGMDADIGLEYGISRAHHVLNRMQEAGYAMQDWESTALIYSGWDLDMSPTIQTRALMPQASHQGDKSQVWAARIKSTRTVHEAWAAFLSCEDQGLDLNQDVYLAMFEKVVEERKRLRLGQAHHARLSNSVPERRPMYPGDLKEVFPPPPSIHQAVYTKTPPPSLDDLHQRMQQQGLRPCGRTLAFLVNNATSLEEGFNYLESAGPEYRKFVDTLVHDPSLAEGQLPKLDFVSDVVLASVVRLLTRFPNSMVQKNFRGIYKHGHNSVDLRRTIGIALFLLDQERRQYRPAWTNLLRGLARPKAPTTMFTHAAPSDRNTGDNLKTVTRSMDAYQDAKHVVSMMRGLDMYLDILSFGSLCLITQHAASAASWTIARSEKSQRNTSIAEAPSENDSGDLLRAHALAHAIGQDSAYICSQFWTLVGYQSRPSTPASLHTRGPEIATRLPRLLAMPSPAVVHAYIRALGILRGYDELSELMHWMRDHWEEYSKRTQLDRNGFMMLRRCLVALRVFLEGRLDGDARSAPKEYLAAVRQVVESVEAWNGWASDEEVEAYIQKPTPSLDDQSGD